MTAPRRDLAIEQATLRMLRGDPRRITVAAMTVGLALVGADLNRCAADFDVLIQGASVDDLRCATVFLSRIVASGLTASWGPNGARTIVQQHLADLATVERP